MQVVQRGGSVECRGAGGNEEKTGNRCPKNGAEKNPKEPGGNRGKKEKKKIEFERRRRFEKLFGRFFEDKK